MIPTKRQGSVDVSVQARPWARGIGLLCLSLQVVAAEPSARGTGFGDVYGCRADGRKSDREMTDCSGIQTRTTRAGVVTLLLSPDQQRLASDCESRKAELILDWRKIERSEANLRSKYPNIAALREGRDADLQPARQSVDRSRTRLADLDKERKRLALEKEFYPNGAPPDLQRKIDQNDALIAAQQQVSKKAQDDVARIEANFDDLEKTMRRLWVAASTPMPSVDCTPEALFLRPQPKTGRR